MKGMFGGIERGGRPSRNTKAAEPTQLRRKTLIERHRKRMAFDTTSGMATTGNATNEISTTPT